jgi:methionine synthase I (cobalamin-dependent)
MTFCKIRETRQCSIPHLSGLEAKTEIVALDGLGRENMENRIAEFLSQSPDKPLLTDGAMGTLLVARGVPAEENLDLQNLVRPEAVARAHRDYLAAGAQIIETNTFGANCFKLAAAGLDSRQEEILRAGVEIARKEAGGALVAGSIGPLGVRLAPYGRVRAEQAEDEFRRIAAILLCCGVDFLLIETMSDVHEALTALNAARAAGGSFVGVSFAFTRDGLTLLGDSPTEVARALAEAGADMAGTNCSSGPAQAIRILRAMRAAAPRLRLSAMPNAGWPERLGGRILYPAGAEYFGRYAAAFADEGVSMIGGCCGTEPAHIAAMRGALDSHTPRRAASAAVGQAPAEARIDPAAELTRLAAKLASGKFTISVEVDPPKGFSTHKLMAGASMLAEAGADVINVADSPMARMRMSPWAVCHLIQEKFDIETVLHFRQLRHRPLRVDPDGQTILQPGRGPRRERHRRADRILRRLRAQFILRHAGKGNAQPAQETRSRRGFHTHPAGLRAGIRGGLPQRLPARIRRAEDADPGRDHAAVRRQTCRLSAQ